jgi:hypothetical protein
MKEASGAREKSASDAAALAADVGKAKDQLIQIVDALDKGRKPLKNKQFPKELSKELSDIAVDFDGSKLAGRRFSSVSADTTRDLFDFISGVEAVKAKKTLVQNLLGRTQKPLEENFALPKDTKPTEWAVVIDMSSAGGVALAKLVPPFIPTKEKPNLPEKLTLEKSKGNNVEVPRWTEKSLPSCRTRPRCARARSTRTTANCAPTSARSATRSSASSRPRKRKASRTRSKTSCRRPRS